MQDVRFRRIVNVRIQVFERMVMAVMLHLAALPLNSGHQINGFLGMTRANVLERHGVLPLEQTLLDCRKDAQTKELENN